MYVDHLKSSEPYQDFGFNTHLSPLYGPHLRRNLEIDFSRFVRSASVLPQKPPSAIFFQIKVWKFLDDTCITITIRGQYIFTTIKTTQSVELIVCCILYRGVRFQVHYDPEQRYQLGSTLRVYMIWLEIRIFDIFNSKIFI